MMKDMFSFTTVLLGIEFKVRKLIEKCHSVERELIEARQENQKLLDIIEKQKEEIMIQETQKEIIKKEFTETEIKFCLAKVSKKKISELTLVEASSLIKNKEQIKAEVKKKEEEK